LLAERPSPGGVTGIGLIAMGLCLINLPHLGAWRQCLRGLGGPASRWALSAGLCISLYTLLDKVAIRLVDALLYPYLAMGLAVAWVTPAVLASVGRRGLAEEWRASGWRSAVAGVAAMAAYAIVLYVMRSGVPAGYVGAAREVSVVFGVVAGAVFLGEK